MHHLSFPFRLPRQSGLFFLSGQLESNSPFTFLSLSFPPLDMHQFACCATSRVIVRRPFHSIVSTLEHQYLYSEPASGLLAIVARKIHAVEDEIGPFPLRPPGRKHAFLSSMT